MKAATVSEIRRELKGKSPEGLVDLCLRLAKFKTENKELLTYLLYEASDEDAYIENIKAEIASQFEQINKRNFYFIKKSVRKILRNTKKYIRYSKKKETEVELLIYFCSELKLILPSRSTVLYNLYNRQIDHIKKIIAGLHPDLQYDYESELEDLL